MSSPVSIQTQSLALRALRLDRNRAKRKQPIMVATASTEHPIGCCLQPIGCSVEAVATMIGCLPTQAIAFGWKPGFILTQFLCLVQHHAPVFVFRSSLFVIISWFAASAKHCRTKYRAHVVYTATTQRRKLDANGSQIAGDDNVNAVYWR